MGGGVLLAYMDDKLNTIYVARSHDYGRTRTDATAVWRWAIEQSSSAEEASGTISDFPTLLSSEDGTLYLKQVGSSVLTSGGFQLFFWRMVGKCGLTTGPHV